MIKHFSIQPNEESLNTFLDSYQPEEIGYPRIDLIEENGKPELKYKTVPPHDYDYSQDYFTIETIDGGTTIDIYRDAILTSIESISYSLDGGETWTSIGNGLFELDLENVGDKVLLKGIRTQGVYSYDNSNVPMGLIYHYINPTGGDCKIYGNILSLKYGDNYLDETESSQEKFSFLFDSANDQTTSSIVDASNLILPTTLANYCYANMFSGCTSLTTAPELPATTLAESCYEYMFSGCTSLTTAPELPATTLAESCYNSMFQGCTSLTTAPELPATTLAGLCYYGMFMGCTSLITAPKLPATTLAYDCYNSMFSGCTSLEIAPQLPATTLAGNCYRSMFEGCTSLTTAPQLPATTLVQSCYWSMFSGCTSLTILPQLPATTLAGNCYNSMFEGCTSLTTAPQLSATTLTDGCYQQMFKGCTSLTTAPQLSATTLDFDCYRSMFEGCTSLTTAPQLSATTLSRNRCYQRMFYGCTNLNYIKAMFTTTPSNDYTQDWVNGVASNGTFIKNTSATWNVTGNNGVPSGWTIQTASS